MQKRIRAARILGSVTACLWLALFPLLHGGSYAHITYDKWKMMLMLTAISLLFGGIVFGLNRRCIRPLHLVVCSLFAWMGLTCFAGSQSHLLNSSGQLVVWMGAGRYEGMATQLCYLAVFLSLCWTPPRMKTVLSMASLGLIGYGTVVAVQYSGVNLFGLFPPGRSIYLNYEFQGTIGNIDMVSGYVLLITPMVLTAWLLSRQHHPLWLLAGLVGITLQLMMEVQSGLLTLAAFLLVLLAVALRYPALRKRVLMLCVGVMACLMGRFAIRLPWLDGVETLSFCLTPTVLALGGITFLLGGCVPFIGRHPGSAIRPRWLILGLVLLVLFGLLLFFFFPFSQDSGAFYEAHELLNGRGLDTFGSWRLGVWRHTLHISGENLLFGTGPDTFAPVLRSHLAEEGAFLGENFDNPHNLYLALLSNSGCPALIFFLLALGMMVTKAIRSHNPFAAALAAGVGAYAMQGFFTFSICLVSPIFWAMLGLGCALIYDKEDSYDSEF